MRYENQLHEFSHFLQHENLATNIVTSIDRLVYNKLSNQYFTDSDDSFTQRSHSRDFLIS